MTTPTKSTPTEPKPAENAAGPAATREPGPRKRQAIVDATLELLTEHGYEGLTIEGVALRSGTNKTTIYRWWPSKPALLAAALVESRALWFEMPNTGSLRRDLEQLVQSVATLLTAEPTAKIAVAALAAAVHNPELALGAKHFFAERLAREQPIFERAKQRRELRRDVDPMTVMDLLIGAVWVRVALRQMPLERSFAKTVVRAVLDGISHVEHEKKSRD